MVSVSGCCFVQFDLAHRLPHVLPATGELSALRFLCVQYADSFKFSDWLDNFDCILDPPVLFLYSPWPLSLGVAATA